jgi:hypothetical protein
LNHLDYAFFNACDFPFSQRGASFEDRYDPVSLIDREPLLVQLPPLPRPARDAKQPCGVVGREAELDA